MNPRIPRHRLGRVAILALALAAPLTSQPGLAQALQGVINVNTASAEELELLPGVGERRAQAIVALRKQRGSFQKVDELALVKGIGEAALARLRPFVKLAGKTTLRVE